MPTAAPSLGVIRAQILAIRKKVPNARVFGIFSPGRWVGEPIHGDGDDEIAPEGDPRVTRIGAWLRHFRLDELPQLYDVLRGRMALVGPRPETPANLSAVDEEQLDRWLSVRPGVTGPTQLAFIAEDELLRQFASPTQTYRRVLVPAKVAHGIKWLATRTLASDLAVLPQTLVVLASRRARFRSRRHIEALLREGEASRGVAS